MIAVLLVAFLAVPVVELYVIVRVAGAIGFLDTIAVMA
jgi:UPF0716 family protein affecting phage T7 exclusion